MGEVFIRYEYEEFDSILSSMNKLEYVSLFDFRYCAQESQEQ